MSTPREKFAVPVRVALQERCFEDVRPDPTVRVRADRGGRAAWRRLRSGRESEAQLEEWRDAEDVSVGKASKSGKAREDATCLNKSRNPPVKLRLKRLTAPPSSHGQTLLLCDGSLGRTVRAFWKAKDLCAAPSAPGSDPSAVHPPHPPPHTLRTLRRWMTHKIGGGAGASINQ
ncbi:hypothetical protein B0H12DRAFT_1241345 [Mycena haematopus]|nr:hypothetical protein B0H12DRAFT_1241345 [Mycena haematopus]